MEVSVGGEGDCAREGEGRGLCCCCCHGDGTGAVFGKVVEEGCGRYWCLRVVHFVDVGLGEVR